MTSSGSLLRPIDVEALREQARNAAPFSYVLIDDFLETDFAHDALRSWPAFEEAAKIGKSFHSINERNKVQITDSSQFPQPLKALNDVLASPSFLEAVSAIFAIPDLLPDSELVGGGMHQTGPRGRLDVHVDFNYIEARKLHRRLNILVYFNDGWRQDWGGQLELWNSDISARIHSIEPIFNRCVIFETSEISYHGVAGVTCPDDTVRRSFAGYYYTKAAPASWTGQSHSTIFKARPEESLKNRMMRVKRTSDLAKRKVKSTIRRLGV